MGILHHMNKVVNPGFCKNQRKFDMDKKMLRLFLFVSLVSYRFNYTIQMHVIWLNEFNSKVLISYRSVVDVY